MAIPEICANKIITLYHSSLFTGHQGVIKTYLTISNSSLSQTLYNYLRSYIKGCHICQLGHNEKPPTRQLQTRINPNYIPLSRLSMDLKVMPRSYRGHKYILCIIDEITNCLITVPIHQAKSEEVGDAFIENVINILCPRIYNCDQDSTFISSLMNYLLKKFNTKIKTVAPYSHQLLQAEHGMKIPIKYLTKHLTNLVRCGQNTYHWLCLLIIHLTS